MVAYYNENEPYAAAWLRNLVADGVIAPGDVDTRDIRDVRPDDLRGYHQCHFFAGVGIWSKACRQAGVPDDYPLWTGSCPCQPFSASGRRSRFADERHLWPHWHWLISQFRPRLVFGEQVASTDGLAWLDLVSSDLEGTNYAGWVEDLCSAGIGSPNIRQRLYFVAERMGDAEREGLEGFSRHGDGSTRWQEPSGPVTAPGTTCGMAEADLIGPGEEGIQRGRELIRVGRDPRHSDWDAGRPGPVNGHWSDVDWLRCRDDRWRPVEPGTFPLAPSDPSRLGRLRAYGNALNLELATEFIHAYFDSVSNRTVRDRTADLV